jgi:predicted patatin/cPLA2 family phospholipase
MDAFPLSLRGSRFFAPLLLAFAVGCEATRTYPPPDADLLASANSEIATHRPDQIGILAQLIDSPLPGAITGHPHPAPARNVLVLSGGGKYGAYSAGVLAGWSAAGTRPTFDVVTGISTGALIAPLAFLGPRYDSLLEQSYTTVRTEDIYRKRTYLSVLFSDALADSGPLRRRIEEQVTDDFLSEIAQAHATGRRLYVGTTNLDTGRLVLWDLGAIASGADLDKRALFQKILLASCAIPGLLPPVPIEIEMNGRRYTELHVDGGVSAAMFLKPGMIPADSQRAGMNTYVITAGKLFFEPKCISRRFIAVSGEAFNELLNAQTRNDLYRVFLFTRLNGGCFAVTSVPQALPEDPNATRFDPVEMRRLFDVGYERAVKGTAWRPTPPGVNPDEWIWPRTGTRFNLQSNQP